MVAGANNCATVVPAVVAASTAAGSLHYVATDAAAEQPNAERANAAAIGRTSLIEADY